MHGFKADKKVCAIMGLFRIVRAVPYTAQEVHLKERPGKYVRDGQYTPTDHEHTREEQ